MRKKSGSQTALQLGCRFQCFHMGSQMTSKKLRCTPLNVRYGKKEMIELEVCKQET